MERSLHTQIVRPLGWLFVIVLVSALIGSGLWSAWQEFSGQAEIRRLEATAAADAARADRAQAEAILAPAEAAARAVDRMSAVATYYGFIAPFGVVWLALALALLGVACGALGTIGLYLLARQGWEDGRDD